MEKGPDGKWGSPVKLPNETSEGESWNGMVGALYRGEADMSMSEFTVLESRRRVVDYSTAVMSDSTHLTMLRPALAIDW